jgi:prevent-host-death family protein
MRRVGAYEAKTHLPRLLAEVARGETITITKHGVPVAVLSPPTQRRRDPNDVIDEITEFQEREQISLGVPYRELIEEGRL